MTEEERIPDARRWGRVLRFLLGGVLLAMTVPLSSGMTAAGTAQILLLLVLLTGLYALIHLGVQRFAPGVHALLGAVLALVPAGLVYVLVPMGDVAVIAFIGISLVVASARGDGGCEVMSIPGVILGRTTHLACIFFSPIDWLESKVSEK